MLPQRNWITVPISLPARSAISALTQSGSSPKRSATPQGLDSGLIWIDPARSSAVEHSCSDMHPTETLRSTRSVKSLNAAAHAAFVPIGIVTVLLGPMLPSLSARWSLNYSQAGSLFTAQFIGATLGAALSGTLVSRRGFRFTINAGLFAIAIGVGTLPITTHAVGLICILCYGFGLGLAIPAANLLVAEVNPGRRSAALNLLNFSWSAGAVACPFLVAAAVRVFSIPLFLYLLAGFAILILFLIATLPRPLLPSAAIGVEPFAEPSPVNWKHRSVPILGALFFLYVGAENAFGGWLTSYTRGVITPTSELSVLMPSFFYTALLLGRWIAPALLKTVDDLTLARSGLALACVGMAVLVLASSVTVVAASAAVVGLGLAAVYPITISMLAQEFGAAASRVGSLMFTLTNLGGASLPWLVGYSSDRFHSLRIGLGVPLAAGIVMNVLYYSKWKSRGDASV